MKVNYSSSNSGGSWWLTDAHWQALERAGWYVEWGGTWYCGSERAFNTRRPKGQADLCASETECLGHRGAESAATADQRRGARATAAWIDAETPHAAILSWATATGLSPAAEGCNCCGEPHTFRWKDAAGHSQYVSGTEVLPYLADPFELEAYRVLRQKFGLE